VERWSTAPRANKRSLGAVEVTRTSNRKGYTAAQFAEDIGPLLPFALPEFRRLGLMKTCAHCGKTLDGVTFVLRSRTVQHGVTEAQVLTICNACATPAPLHGLSFLPDVSTM
jgi:hypothetical protein